MLRNLISSQLRAGGSPLDLGASTSSVVERRIIRVGIVLTVLAVLDRA